jgi:hypothetical protein
VKGSWPVLSRLRPWAAAATEVAHELRRSSIGLSRSVVCSLLMQPAFVALSSVGGSCARTPGSTRGLRDLESRELPAPAAGSSCILDASWPSCHARWQRRLHRALEPVAKLRVHPCRPAGTRAASLSAHGARGRPARRGPGPWEVSILDSESDAPRCGARACTTAPPHKTPLSAAWGRAGRPSRRRPAPPGLPAFPGVGSTRRDARWACRRRLRSPTRP